jgi:hypothetical protein
MVKALSPFVILLILAAMVAVAAIVSTPRWRALLRETFASASPGTMDQLMSTRAPSGKARMVRPSPAF